MANTSSVTDEGDLDIDNATEGIEHVTLTVTVAMTMDDFVIATEDNVSVTEIPVSDGETLCRSLHSILCLLLF